MNKTIEIRVNSYPKKVRENLERRLTPYEMEKKRIQEMQYIEGMKKHYSKKSIL